MNKVNQKDLGLVLQAIIQAFVKLHANSIIAEPWVRIASEFLLKGQQNVEDVIRQNTVTKTSPFSSECVSPFLSSPKINIPLIKGEFDSVAAWENAVRAMKEAVTNAATAWNQVHPTVNAMTQTMAKWLKREMDAEKVKVKFASLAYEAEVYSRTHVLSYNWNFIGVNEDRGLYYHRVSYQMPIGQHERERVKGKLDALLADWIKDMEGIWGTSMTIRPSVGVDESSGAEIRTQAQKVVQVMAEVGQMLATKRPYTEVRYAVFWDDQVKDLFIEGALAIVAARCAFEELEKGVEQMAKDAVALSTALSQYFRFHEVSSGL
jgi:hypothetical protein